MDLPPVTVPWVATLPHRGDNRFDIVSFVDFLIGRLVLNAPASLDTPLHVDSDPMNWELTTYSDGEPTVQVLATTAYRLRSPVLARIGNHFLNGQLYGGYGKRTVICKDSTATCFFHLGNSGQSMRWLRLVASQVE